MSRRSIYRGGLTIRGAYTNAKRGLSTPHFSPASFLLLFFLFPRWPGETL